MAGQSCEMDDLQSTLTRIQKLMALSGLSWDYQQSTSAKRCNTSAVASKMYSVLVCILLALNFIQLIPYYTNAESFLETSLTVANTTTISLGLIYWALSTNIHSKVRIFHERLRETQLKFNSCVSATRLNQSVKRACVCIIVAATCTCVGIGVVLSPRGDTSNHWYWPSLLLSSIVGGYTSLLNHSLLLLFMTISLLLTHEYDNCTLRLSRTREELVKEEDIENVRGYHASLTDLVEHTCSIVSRHVAAGYVSSFITVCFCLYSSINDEKSFSKIAIAAAALYISTLHLIALTYIGVRLHEAAHRPLNVLLDMTGENMPERVIGLLQVTLFANKLSQRQIGITALGLMTITKDTILTILGTLLTYVFIVIQFKPISTVGIHQNVNATLA